MSGSDDATADVRQINMLQAVYDQRKEAKKTPVNHTQAEAFWDWLEYWLDRDPSAACNAIPGLYERMSAIIKAEHAYHWNDHTSKSMAQGRKCLGRIWRRIRQIYEYHGGVESLNDWEQLKRDPKSCQLLLECVEICRKHNGTLMRELAGWLEAKLEVREGRSESAFTRITTTEPQEHSVVCTLEERDLTTLREMRDFITFLEKRPKRRIPSTLALDCLSSWSAELGDRTDHKHL